MNDPASPRTAESREPDWHDIHFPVAPEARERDHFTMSVGFHEPVCGGCGLRWPCPAALPDDGREGLDKTAEERRMTRAHPWAIAHEGIAGIKATPDSENEP